MWMMEAALRGKKQWDLEQLNTIYETDRKAVYASKSPQWGDVILKVDEDKRELECEYAVLKVLNGACSCKVFAYDEEQGLLLEERIVPGTVLRKEPDAMKRVGCFLQVFRTIHREAGHASGFDTYLDWLERASLFCRVHKVEKWVADGMEQSCQIGRRMFETYKDRVLLHGDLHHDNILLNDKGTYSMIDPKGVIGPAVFDLPRFLLNELDYPLESKRKSHIEEIARLIGERLNVSSSNIRELFYMEVMLANVWNIEDGEKPDRQQMQMAEELLRQ